MDGLIRIAGLSVEVGQREPNRPVVGRGELGRRNPEAVGGGLPIAEHLECLGPQQFHPTLEGPKGPKTLQASEGLTGHAEFQIADGLIHPLGHSHELLDFGTHRHALWLGVCTGPR